MKTEVKMIPVRFPVAEAEKIKNEFWKTAPKHRLSFNAWMIEVVRAGLKEVKS